MEQIDYKLNIGLPYFSGHVHVEEYLDWLNSVEKFFDYAEIFYDKRVSSLGCKVRI